MTVLATKVVWTVTVAYAVLLAGVSLLPSGAGAPVGWDTAISPSLQNFLHIPAYAVLAILASLAMRPSFKTSLASMVWVSLGCCVFGLVLEFAQTVVPGRTGSLMDALLNAAGAVIGCLIAIVAAGRNRRRGIAMAAGRYRLENRRAGKV